MIHLTMFFVSLLYVGLRSFQQLNVQHSQYAWVPVISMMMAFADYWSVNTVVSHGWSIAIPVGLGGAVGACISMYVHARMRKSGRRQADKRAF